MSRHKLANLTPIIHNQERQTNVRAAIYARVSSLNQKFNYSVKEQIACCRKYVAQRDWTTNYIFFDEQSGGTIDRPKFQLMLEKAQRGFFDVIVFWKLDRFCRSLVDLVNVERVLRGYGVALSSVTEYVDTTTSVGRFNFRSIGSVAELERELIGERARLGLHALAKEGKWPNSHPPLGFGKKNDGKLVINQEAKLVTKIFEMYLENPVLAQVAFDLNEQGVRTKEGKRWNAIGVRNILTNKIYIGTYQVAGVRYYIEDYRLISNNIFLQVQSRLRRYENRGSKRLPMPENRRSKEIDNIFNKFLMNLNSTERSPECSNHRTKTLTNEKAVFKLINDGWNLIKVVGDEFTVRKTMKKLMLKGPQVSEFSA